MSGNFLSAWRRFFPLSERKAIKIAIDECSKKQIPDGRAFRASNERPPAMYINRPIEEPCWYIHAPWCDGLDGACLRSSRVLVVSKITGAVLYDGSANDEG